MKATAATASLFTLISLLCTAAPLWECSFDHWSENSRRAYLSTGTQRFFGGTKGAGAGVGGSDALLVDDNHSCQLNPCPEFSEARAFTLEVSCRLDKGVESRWGNAIFCIARGDWGKGVFRLRITVDKCLEASFHTKLHVPKEDKKLVVLSSPLTWETGKFYTIRVASQSGGALKVWRDGVLVASQETGSWGMNDCVGDGATTYYPVFTLGNDYSEHRKTPAFRALNGVFDNLRVWTNFEEPSALEAASSATVTSATSDDILFLENGKSAATGKFRVAERPGEYFGTTQPAEERFVKAASWADVTLDEQFLTVVYHNPVAENARILTNSGYLWEGDVVELFIRPDRSTGSYFQYAQNAGGRHEAIAYSEPLVAISGFHSQATFANTVSDTLWTVTMKIPRSEIKLEQAAPGTVFQMNVTRCGKSCGKISSWSPVLGNFHALDSMNCAVIGTPAQGARKAIDNFRKRLEPFKGNSKGYQECLKELQKLSAIAANEQMIAAEYQTIDRALKLLQPKLVALALDNIPCLLWKCPQPWGNSLKPSAVMEKLEDIRITLPQNSHGWVGFAFSNFSDKAYLGQLKFFSEKRVQEKRVYDSYNRAFKFLDHPLHERLKLYEGLEVHAGDSTDPIYDPLLPLPLNTLVRAGGRQTIPLWLRVSSQGLKPGTYTGVFIMKASERGFQDQQVAFTLEVLPIDLGNEWPDSAQCNEMLWRTPQKGHIQFLADHHVNFIYAGCMGSIRQDYPVTDKDGNILRHSDYAEYDAIVDEHIRCGLPKERIKLMVYLELTRHGLRRDGEIKQKFNSPQWKKAFKAWLGHFLQHYRDKYGITKDRIVFWTRDEVHGDIHDPKSSIYDGWLQGKIMKEADPEVHICINPLPNFMAAFKQNRQAMEKLFEYYDMVEFFRPFMTPEIVQWAQKLGKTVMTYGIYDKTTSPAVYRKDYWQNLRDGFSDLNWYWNFDQHAGEDGFNGFDGVKNHIDYGSVYADGDYGTVLTSRRQEAHDLGLEDLRLVRYCEKRLRMAGNDALWAEFHAIVKRGAGGSWEEVEAAHDALMKLALKLQ